MINNEIELLAPAGKWDVLKEVALAGADAVYLGGKRFNMRMLKPDFNFSDQELMDASSYLHEQGKKIYITINNLYYEPELSQLEDYLYYLQEINVDALIIQDAALIKLHRQLGLTVPLHASVQMGTSSTRSINLLKDWGIERVILSKNLSLEEINLIYKNTGMELEFFAHGDLCVSHAGQCYMSSYACDQSGNRGLCVKPCRWPYKLEGSDFGFGFDSDEERYYLAHNDLCLFHFIKRLIEAGVVSFKLEGRMRSAEYLRHLVSNYRVALDYAKGSRTTEELEQAYQRLYENRVRDFTTGNLFSRPGLDAIGFTGEREPLFVSTPFAFNRLKSSDYVENAVTVTDEEVGLSIKIGSLSVVPNMLELGIETLILGLEDMRQQGIGWTADKVREVFDLAQGTNTSISVETPRVVTEDDMPELQKRLFDVKNLGIDTVMVNDYGSLHLAREMGFSVHGGYGLNMVNSMAVDFGCDNSLVRIELSPELNLARLDQVLDVNKNDKLELLVHGPLCGMVSDLCVPSSSHGEEPGFCVCYCLSDQYSLVDELGQRFRIRSDENCRNYIYFPYDLCLFNYLPHFVNKGLRHFRIDGQFYDDTLLVELADIYQEALRAIKDGKGDAKTQYERLLGLFSDGLCLNNGSKKG